MPKQFAILRFAKRHKGSIAKIGNHHERAKESYKSNPDIKREKSVSNYHLKNPTATYTQMIKQRLDETKCRTRKDSVLLADTFIGGSPEFMNGLSDFEQREYFNLAYNFIAENVGEHNILSAVIHLDEKTPHMHLVFTPITADNRLTAKEVLGNPQKFEKWQNDFYECMSERWDCLERGKSAKETGRKHIPVRLFKQSARLNDEVDELRALLQGLGMFNVANTKKELLQKLEKWYQGANSFNGQVKYLVSQDKALQSENAELIRKLKETKENFMERIAEKDDFINENMRDYSSLVERYNNNIDFLDSIPDELYNSLKQRFNAQRAAEMDIEDGYEMDDDD